MSKDPKDPEDQSPRYQIPPTTYHTLRLFHHNALLKLARLDDQLQLHLGDIEKTSQSTRLGVKPDAQRNILLLHAARTPDQVKSSTAILVQVKHTVFEHRLVEVQLKEKLFPRDNGPIRQGSA